MNISTNVIGWILIFFYASDVVKYSYLHIYKTSIQAGFQDSSVLHAVAYVADMQFASAAIFNHLCLLTAAIPEEGEGQARSISYTKKVFLCFVYITVPC